MSGDLISREALKKAINNLYNLTLDGLVKFGIEKAVKEIDNAPTIDIKDQIAGAYNEGYMCGSREAEKARPHWIKIFENPYTNGYICSNCGHKIQVTEQFLPQVTECEACGADMQTKRDGGK